MFHLLHKDLNEIEYDELSSIHMKIRGIQRLLENAQRLINLRMRSMKGEEVEDTPAHHKQIKYAIGAIIKEICYMSEEARKVLMTELQAAEDYQKAKRQRDRKNN